MRKPEPVCASALRKEESELSLAEALDRLIHRGVAIQGNIALGLAGVDLLFLDLRLLLASIDTISPAGTPNGLLDIGGPKPSSPRGGGGPRESCANPAVAADLAENYQPSRSFGARGQNDQMAEADVHPSRDSTPAKGLVRLVLTLVKLLHDVLERQALRRMIHDRLSPTEIEALGLALHAQAAEIERLRHLFGFSEQDLALDLGLHDDAA